MGVSMTSLTGNGLRDWYWQRISAVVLASYTVFLAGFFAYHGSVTYEQWHRLFDCQFVRIISLITLVSLIAHAWVGVWTIFTDYVKCVVLKFSLQTLVILVLLGYFFWGLEILWSL